MCVRSLITFLVASDLLCFYCIFLFCVYYYFYLCVFLYFVFNFLHCSTGQKLMFLGRCILSILLFPFIFIVYLVYDFIINK